MWSPPDALPITEDQRRTLQTWIRARNTPQKVVLRARIVLMAATGMANRRIARELKTSRPTVVLWRNRFVLGGPTALTKEEPGRGRKPQLTQEKVKQIVEATLHSKPAAATHWSTRTMAKAQGVSQSTVCKSAGAVRR